MDNVRLCRVHWLGIISSLGVQVLLWVGTSDGVHSSLVWIRRWRVGRRRVVALGRWDLVGSPRSVPECCRRSLVGSVLGPSVHWEVEGALCGTGGGGLWPGLLHQKCSWGVAGAAGWIHVWVVGWGSGGISRWVTCVRHVLWVPIGSPRLNGAVNRVHGGRSGTLL